jgi:hypothetical protein
MDPVYASTKFFDALVGVHGYLKLPVYKAAQAVQRSADGTAYVQYTPTAAGLSRGFSGNVPRSVWCWYTGEPKHQARLAAASRQLTHAFGPLSMRTEADPVLRITVDRGMLRRVLPPWAVSHARRYGFAEVRVGGYWRMAKGERLDPQPGHGAAGYGRGRLIICEWAGISLEVMLTCGRIPDPADRALRAPGNAILGALAATPRPGE